MSWIDFIPASLIQLGAIMLVLAVFLVFVDVPGKGVPWDKVGAWFAIIGGFGVGGGAAGWVGTLFANATGSAMRGGETATARLFGVGVLMAIVVCAALWAYSRARGQGIDAKSKFKALVVVGLMALVGTMLSAIPEVYGWADDGVHIASGAFIDLIQTVS